MAIMFLERNGPASHHVLQRRLSVPLPAYQSKNDMNPTLLVSWFCTILSLIIILIRLLGRWVRNEKLFSEDKIMFWSMIPLLGRMAFVHVILIWGTNNTVTAGLTDVQIQHRIIGSKLVLPARILFATYIWTAKVTVLEFLQKLVVHSWHTTYTISMRLVYGFLALTYVAVVVATLAECHPFSHYWQVIPDPGTACRATPVQLITMGVCEIATDLVLVIFPIPLVLISGMTTKRKASLILLFLLSLILVAVTAYRVPSTLERHASQQYRSLLASLEILASTSVANAIVIGSFLRDRGVKKAKYRATSVDGSILSRVATSQQARSKSITQHHWGSDEDLVRDLGMSLRPSLRHGSTATNAANAADAATRLGPIAEVIPPHEQEASTTPRRPTIDTNWNFSRPTRADRKRRNSDISSMSSSSTDIKLRELRSQMEEPVSPGTEYQTRKMSFFETGETLDSPYVSNRAAPDINLPQSRMFLSDVGGLLGSTAKLEDEQSIVLADSQSNQSKTSLHSRDPRRSSQYASPSERGSMSGRTAGHRPSRSPLRHVEPYDLEINDAGGLLK